MPADFPKEAHLQMIQDVITRMANNSFLLKGWAVTLVAGLFALGAASQGASWLGFVALGPPLAFWFLDAYYLQQERLFRKVYDKVRTSSEDLQYGLNPMQVLTPEERNPKTLSWGNCFGSKTESGFYLPLLLVVLVAASVLCFVPKPSSPDSKPEGQPAATAPATPGGQ